MTNDVEKRWDDPHAMRSAMAYAAVVILIAIGAFAAY